MAGGNGDDTPRPAESTEFDAEVETVGPDGTIQRTPVRSDDPRVQPYVRAGMAVPLTPERRQAHAEARASAARREDLEGTSLANLAGHALTTAVNEATLNVLPHLAGPEAQARLAELREAFPILTGASRLAGWVVPALLTGGGAGAVRGAGGAALGRLAAFTPAGLATRAGLAAEGIVGRAMAARGLSAGAARGLGLAVGAGIDGAASGALDVIAQANLDGTPLEAEEILSGTGVGAGLGLLGGGLFALPGVLRSRAARRAADGGGGAASELFGPVTPVAPSSFSRARPPEADIPALVRAGGRVSGVPESHLRVIAAAGPDAFSPDAFRAAVTDAATSLARGMNIVEEMAEVGLDRARRMEAVASRLDPAMLDDASPAAQHALRQAHGEQMQVLAQAARAVSGDRASGQIGALRRLLGRGSPRTMREALERWDRALGTLSEEQWLDRAVSSSAGPGILALREDLLARLRSLGEPGARLAAVHEDLLRRYERHAPAREFADFRAREGRGRWEVRGERLPAAFGGGVGEAIPRERVEAMAEMLLDAERRAENAAGLFGLDATEARRRLAEATGAVQRADAWSQVREITIRSQLQEKQAAGFYAALGLSGIALGGALGAQIGEGEGAVAGGAVGLALAASTHPVAALMLLQRLGGARRTAQQRLASGSGRLRGALESGRWASPARRAAPKLVTAFGEPGSEEEREAYVAVRDRVHQLVGNPAALEARLAEGPGAVGAAINPTLGGAMADAHVRAVHYLAQHLPPTSAQPAILQAWDDELPSTVEMSSFLRRVWALEAPLSLLDLAAEGALEPEHVETVATVYPGLLQLLRSEVSGVLGDLRTLPSFQARAQLGTLLGVDVDDTYSARSLHLLQSAYAQTKPQERSARGTTGPTTTRAVSLQTADDTFSASQSVEHSLR